jgi:hypothetical protein
MLYWRQMEFTHRHHDSQWSTGRIGQGMVERPYAMVFAVAIRVIRIDPLWASRTNRQRHPSHAALALHQQCHGWTVLFMCLLHCVPYIGRNCDGCP